MIHIQGNCDEIRSMVNKNEMEFDDTDALYTGIYLSEAEVEDRSIRSNTDFLCLIGIDHTIADQLLAEYQGYLFCFLNQEGCVDFLNALTDCLDTLENAYTFLHDVYVELGHKEGSCRGIGKEELGKGISEVNDEM